ncbi:MAG: hypothetical protein LBE76_08985 [Nitrososphaerota archaeon]|jgi:hypothetical protein|nr:hypothetical protein [Nitrososphaerota archaeon]
MSLILETIAELNSNNIPTIVTTLGLALLGILIPFTIAIVQDILQRKNEQDVNYAVLDLHVIFDEVFKFKHLIICAVLIFVPFIFWDLQIAILRIAEIILAV